MTITGWFIFFLVIQVVHFLGTWKLYVKAGRQAWEALIPIYNAVILMKIINRPWWWVILLFIPIVNLMMFPIVWVETIRSFGRTSTLDSFLVILTLGLYIFYINYALDVTYRAERDLQPQTAAGEWVSSIVFAIIAATIVHTYVMQPYTIPTSSLEKTLLVGDFLFVSKFHYGARIPMTTVALPMVHDTIPFIKSKSYLAEDDATKYNSSWKNKTQLPYLRIPGFQKIKRNDIVVFSWPVDTVERFYQTPNRLIKKPIDKKSNYVKRCVGIPGDSLSIIDGYIYINGKQTVLPDRAKPQYRFTVNTDGQSLSPTILTKRYNIREFGRFGDGYEMFMTDKEAAMLAKNPMVKSIVKQTMEKGSLDPSIFPQVNSLGWNRDNMGPIYIPEQGKTVELTKETLPFYKRIITEYENNSLIVNGDEILINGKEANSYTFKQNYYWMMGDNRHNSEDSRFWGFVPFDHVVGKPVFIWFSWDANATGIMNKIRWNRLFTTVGGDGEPVSYLPWFIGAMLIWRGFVYYRKKKQA
ncbi:signal peptidase I [Flavobacteriaceae bacterium F08102]|nr:signal peptidase I [Flavobacteriaceae bacterium F08102]